MRPVDPKLIDVFLLMLEDGEVEVVLCGDHDLLTPLQSLRLLRIILRTTPRLADACKKIFQQIEQEVERLGRDFAKNGSELNEEVQSWIETLRSLASDSLASERKNVLFGFILDVVTILKPFSNVCKLVQDLAQRIAIDLDVDNFWLASTCIGKFSMVDEQIYYALQQLVQKCIESRLTPDDCLKIYLDQAEHLTAEVSEMLFNRAVAIFNDEKSGSLLGKVWRVITLKSESTPKTKNLARLFSRCVLDLNLDSLDSVQLVLAACDHPGLSSILKFFANLSKLGLLEGEIVQKSENILKQVDHFTVELCGGRLSLQTFLIVNDKPRISKLLALHECLAESGVMEPSIKRWKLSDLIKLRSEEINEYFSARDDFRKFVEKFELKGSEEIAQILAQFQRDPAKLSLEEVCVIRDQSRGSPVLRLQLVAPKDLTVLRKHNGFFSDSAIFRMIHDQVREDEAR